MMHLPGQRYLASYRRGQRTLTIDAATWMLIAAMLLAIVALEVMR